MFSRLALLPVLAATLISVPAFAEDAPAEAEKGPLTIDSSVGLFSNYMFRGQSLYDGASIQPSLTATYDTGYGSVSANLWMHISGNSRHHDSRFTELDETIKYSNTWDDFTGSVGHTWYTYSDYGSGDDIEDTAEVFASVSHNSYLTPTLSVYNDYSVFDAQYYELGFSHLFEDVVGKDSNLTPFVAFGFESNGEKLYQDDGLVQVTAGASTALSMGDLSVTPTVNYSFKVDEKTINQFWFGVSFGYSR